MGQIGFLAMGWVQICVENLSHGSGRVEKFLHAQTPALQQCPLHFTLVPQHLSEFTPEPDMVMVKMYSSSQHASPLRELTCHMGSHVVTCHPACIPTSRPAN